MSAKHTPGPWETAEAHGAFPSGEDGHEWFVRRPGDDVSIAAEIIDPETCEPSEANARLISAAPEMFAVAMRLLDESGRDECGCNHTGASCLLCDARAAITKATNPREPEGGGK